MDESYSHVGRYIGRLYNLMRRNLWKGSTPLGYSSAEMKLLSFILDPSNQSVVQKDIEEEFSLRPPTATEILKKMEKNGLITRVQEEEDARCKRILPTEKSIREKDAVFSYLHNFDKEIIKGIPEKDVIAFCRTAERMIENMKKEITED